MNQDDSEHPPGTVSNQMPEEAEAGHDEGGELRRRKHSPGEEEPAGGEAGEGSQSTGHPDNAG